MEVRNFNRYDGRERDAGNAAGADERIARSAKAEERVRKRLAYEALRGPRINTPPELKVVCEKGQFVPILPAAFVAEVVSKVEIHVARGAFHQAISTLESAAEQWKLRRRQKDNSESAVSEKLAWHVSNIFETRICNVIESKCSGTIGALLECFPRAFVHSTQCGPIAIRKIAETLARLGVITQEECERRITDYHDALRQRIA